MVQQAHHERYRRITVRNVERLIQALVRICFYPHYLTHAKWPYNNP